MVPPALPPGRLVDVPGRGALFVRQSPAGPGDGPTILLLHGWLLCSDVNWFALHAGIARHGPVLAVDARGHGRGLRTQEPFSLEAAADDAAALLVHLGTGPAVVLGYSMGGSIALLMARRHPGSVAGLVLQSTALHWRSARHERVLWRLMRPLDWALRTGVPRKITGRYLAGVARRDPRLRPILPWLMAEAFRGHPSDLAQAGRALGDFDARPFVSGVGVPAAVVVSTGDRMVEPDRQRDLARAIAGAATVESDIGHNAWLTQPDRLGEALDAALGIVVSQVGPRPVESGRPEAGRGSVGAE
jgi:pimeloyl-ACP methyl ester carboxylesterase